MQKYKEIVNGEDGMVKCCIDGTCNNCMRCREIATLVNYPKKLDWKEEECIIKQRLERIAASRELLVKENRESLLAVHGLDAMIKQVTEQANEQIKQLTEEKEQLSKKVQSQVALDKEYEDEQRAKEVRLAEVESLIAEREAEEEA
jgi:hypothetical protein